MHVRRANRDDAPAIAALLAESFEEFRARYTAAAFDATVLDTARVGKRIDEGPVWVALHGGATVGTVSAVVKESGVYVRGMAVVPRARGLHAGRNLLDAVAEFAKSQNAPRLFLSTTPFLDRAISLYEQYGFQRR